MVDSPEQPANRYSMLKTELIKFLQKDKRVVLSPGDKLDLSAFEELAEEEEIEEEEEEQPIPRGVSGLIFGGLKS